MDDVFPTAVYLLCFLTSTACAWLLGRSYKRTGARLLFWSAACFFFLAANNLLLVVDLLIFANVDLRLGRLLLAMAAVSVMIFGLIWDLGEE